ncbi:MAG TPA: membrane protein insertion efficiency factor YidD [Rhizomicrobium sp.]|jgi:hypothetical protein|nr:membrane protein insertion efficiency factor YidD [Rhizomicrobium sp.]
MSQSLGQTLRTFAVTALVAPVRAYQIALSPLLPAVCRFTPTCSAYAIEALRTHGPLKGLSLTARRLLRCHPITWLGGSSGFDPVPPAR